MAVFPESMNKLDARNVPKSLDIVENYIRYMTERMEFSTSKMTKSVNSAGVSSVALLQLVQDVGSAVSVLQSTVNGMTGTMTELSGRMTAQEKRAADLESRFAALESRVKALEGKGTGGTT